jgi:hypothetical protein
MRQGSNAFGSNRNHEHGSRNFILSLVSKSYISGLACLRNSFPPVSASAAATPVATCYIPAPTFALTGLLIVRLKAGLLLRKNKGTPCVAKERKCGL